MFNIDHDQEKYFSLPKYSTNKDENEFNSHRIRNDQQSSNIDAKVYVGNVPTDHLTDGQLCNFFKPFGKILDIRVYKGYLFVQFEKINDAKKLIKEGENCLMLKGNKLDILPAMDRYRKKNKLSSIETSHQDYQNSEEQSSKYLCRNSSDYDRHSTNSQTTTTERYAHKYQHKNNSIQNNRNYFGHSDGVNDEIRDSNVMEIDADNDLLSTNHQLCYTILTEPKQKSEFIHCRIIIVNPRTKEYAEEMSCHLESHGLITSIILLRENYTLIKAIEDAKSDQCLYGIIIMPMHQQRHTASFHILHGQIEEHRNLPLEDGYQIILTNFNFYKQRIQNENQQKNQFVDQQNKTPKINLNDKFPLSMLLCLLADGRQLTLDEIDRILVYLLEKKCKMLTLPSGTLPPLPAQYATSNSMLNDCSSSSQLSSTMVQQIRQLFSSQFNSTEQNPKEQNSFCHPIVSPSFHYSSSIPYPTTTTLPNSAAADAAAAIFQAYSQFNLPTTTTNK